MLDDNQDSSAAPTSGSAKTSTTTTTSTTRRRAAGRPAGPPAPVSADIFSAPAPAKKAPKAAKRAASAPKAADETSESPAPAESPEASAPESGEAAPKKKAPRKRAPKKAAPAPSADEVELPIDEDETAAAPVDEPTSDTASDETPAAPAPVAGGLVFQAPPAVKRAPRRPRDDEDDDREDDASLKDEPRDEQSRDDDSGDDESGAPKRRRRSRGGRRRSKGGEGESEQDQTSESADPSTDSDTDADAQDGGEGGSPSSRRRRRRARAGEDASTSPDDPDNTVVKVRDGRSAEDEITGVTGSTRLEAKKQRRREGREAGRRRAPIVSESEFLARRESVDRKMVVRQHRGTGSDQYTQIAVLEDKVLVEHYVARESQTSLIGNVYIGKVQNVLPSMEAAFVDIGAGRNAVIYAGEVDWSGVQNGKARKIEEALSPGQKILVQVTKDPIGQKGARLTSQISLPGRFLVYVPGGGSNGISRKLPDTERARLKTLLKEVLPEEAGVIVRTAAEGASEDQLTRDVAALKARWEDIERKVEAGKAPELLYAEPDLMIKVVRDLFNEDFAELVVEGDDAWDNIEAYVGHVAPDLRDRVRRWEKPEGENAPADSFADFRIDEQIHKALDRKVWLPSGGSLIIDRTEAMTVVDVNTGKFTGSGGNLEETVTKNNLEAAEEIVRQLRLRDIGGIIVIDFIDMVLESNRDLVLRRLVECLGRDRTRHQVAEVTSLGLVQMTRKRIGTGLVESFSVECDHCKGRGLVITAEPVEPRKDEPRGRGRRGGRGGNGGESGNNNGNGNNGNGGNGNGGGGGRGQRGGRGPKPEAAVQPEAEPESQPDETAQTPDVVEPVAPLEVESTATVEEAPTPVEATSEPTPAPTTGAPVLTDEDPTP